MAIRFEYNPGATGGLAAYAAGRGRKRERELKYAADLALRGQERRDRYNLIGQQQQFALEMELGRSRREALRDVGRSVERRGALKYAADLALDRDELAAKRAAAAMKLTDVVAIRKRAESAADSLDIPSWVSPSDKVELEKKKATIKAFLKPDMDFSDPGVQKTFNEQLDSFYNTVAAKKPPSPAEEAKGSIVYRDPVSGELSDEAGPGRIPYQSTSRGLELLEQPEQQDPNKEYNDAVMKQYEKNLAETDDENKPVYTEETAMKAARDRQDAIERGRQMLTGGPAGGLGARMNSEDAPKAQPTAPQPSGGGATGSWGETQPTGEPMARPLPAGVPPNATWISDDTIRLPDGRVIRRKKE